MKRILFSLAAAVCVIASPGASQQPPATQQPSDISTSISSGDPGATPRFAVPDFIALSKDAETIKAAKTIAEVLWNDLNFEREFALVPRDVNATIPAATSMADVPLDRWREVNADGVIIGTIQKLDAGVRLEVRLFNVRRKASVFGREYSGS